MNHWMQGFNPPIHHFRKISNFANINHRDASADIALYVPPVEINSTLRSCKALACSMSRDLSDTDIRALFTGVKRSLSKGGKLGIRFWHKKESILNFKNRS